MDKNIEHEVNKDISSNINKFNFNNDGYNELGRFWVDVINRKIQVFQTNYVVRINGVYPNYTGIYDVFGNGLNTQYAILP